MTSRRAIDLTDGCGCKRARHEHGQYVTYNLHLCDCLLCKAANRDRRNTRYREKLYGRFRLVDAQPVRDHVLALQAQGMGWRRVAHAAGVSTSTVAEVLYGRLYRRGGTDSRPPRRQIDRALAAKILSVELDLAPSAHVDGTGSLRRLRALRAIGWTRAALAARLGRASGNLDLAGRYPQVTASYAQAIKSLYDELWDQPQDGPVAARSRARALDLGWAPPMAWDDDTIDDPDAVSDLGDRPSAWADLDDILLLIDSGESLDQVAARTGTTRDALVTRLRRARPDLLDRAARRSLTA